MKKSFLLVALIFSFTLLANSSSFAQSPDDYVRNAKVVPDFRSSGWVHDSSKDTAMGEFASEVYMNNSLGLILFLEVRNHNGSREELMLRFGSKNVGRAALKVDGKWYLGKGPFYENSVKKPENGFKQELTKDGQGNIVKAKLSLETLDGLKSIVLIM